MHLILMTRGINHQRDIWKTMMQGQFFNFKQSPILKDEKTGELLKNEDGTYKYGPEQLARVQGALRPIELWEYVFPEPVLPQVLAMLGVHKNYNELRPEVKNWAWILRKMMGAKKIPDIPELKNKEWNEITMTNLSIPGLAVYPIGIRYDPHQDYIFSDVGAFYQEGL